MPTHVQQFTSTPDPFDTLQKFLDLPAPLLLESTTRNHRLGRYSFLTADPIEWFARDTVAYGDDPFKDIAAALADFPADTIPGLPPFQGGAAGLLGYELGHTFERLPPPKRAVSSIPVLAVGIYPWVIAWDHGQDRAWLIAHGDAEKAAESRAADVLDRLNGPPASIRHPLVSPSPPLPISHGRRSAGQHLLPRGLLPRRRSRHRIHPRRRHFPGESRAATVATD